MTNVEHANALFRTWMHEHLDRATHAFGLVVTSQPVWGWCWRSISAPADGVHGPCWLRVGSEQGRHIDAMPEMWTGTVSAGAITGVAKPRVLDSMEWDEPEQGRRVRADVMTLLPGRPCSDSEVLRAQPELRASWWDELRRSLDMLATVRTERFSDRGDTSRPAREVFGVDVRFSRWATCHRDLHWANLLGPQLGILDWEMWGRAPAAMDAAGLYCYSLLVPDVAATVRDVFADLLDGDHGRAVLLDAAAKILQRIERTGDLAQLDAPLRVLAADLVE
ncbi:MAG: aminoglycoside phosphotransferase [Pseudonocardiaceae bacterium]|nr:aminoglycoside phosphotransferase [Pseudonocardiaceae bacterium]